MFSVNSDEMNRPPAVDSLDARILLALEDAPDSSILGVAKLVGVSRNTVHARLQRLTRSGVVGAFSGRVSPAALGFPLMAFVSLAVSQREGANAADRLRTIPEIVEVHITTGDADLLAKVVARDTTDLRRITDLILDVSGIVRSSTVISLDAAMPYQTRSLLQRLAASVR